MAISRMSRLDASKEVGVTTLSKAFWIVILAIVALGLLSMLFLAGISPAD